MTLRQSSDDKSVQIVAVEDGEGVSGLLLDLLLDLRDGGRKVLPLHILLPPQHRRALWMRCAR